MSTQEVPIQQGNIQAEQLRSTIVEFLNFNGIDRQESMDTVESMFNYNRGSVDFFGRRIIAQREPASSILESMVKQGIIRLNNLPQQEPGVRDCFSQSSDSGNVNDRQEFQSGQGLNGKAQRGTSQNKQENGKLRQGKTKLYLVKDDPFGRAHEQFRIYGGRTALQVSVIHSKEISDGIDCIMIAFSNVDASKGKLHGKNQFGWDRSIQFALSDIEALCLVNLVLGRQNTLLNPMPLKKSGRYEYVEGIYHKSPDGSSKTLKGHYTQNGDDYTHPNGVQLNMVSKGSSIRVNIAIPDRIRMASFILSKLQRTSTYRGLTSSDIISICRDIM